MNQGTEVEAYCEYTKKECGESRRMRELGHDVTFLFFVVSGLIEVGVFSAFQ